MIQLKTNVKCRSFWEVLLKLQLCRKMILIFLTNYQRCTQVSNVKSQESLKSLGTSLKSSRKSFTSSPKSSLKSLPNLSFLPCLGRSFTNYVTQICVICTHPTQITYYGDALANEANTIPPSTILKISLSRNTYLLFILQLYEYKGPMKLLRLNVNDRLKYPHKQIISLSKDHLLHFAWVVDDAKCIVVTRVCVSVCLSVCPRPYAHTTAWTQM